MTEPGCPPEQLKPRCTFSLCLREVSPHILTCLEIFTHFPISSYNLSQTHSLIDRDNFKRGSSNTQSACRISYTSVIAVLSAPHICEWFVWLVSARLSALVSLLLFLESEPGRSVAACLMSAAVLCVEARQSQPTAACSGVN